MATFGNIQTRYLYLIGDTSDVTADAPGQSHINYAIKDILLEYPFSWSLKSATGVISSGTFTLASDLNFAWGLFDARIVNSGQGADNIFTPIPIETKNYYATTDYVYWITQSPAGTLTFNTVSGLTGTVTYFYYQLPADLVNTSDICLIPDPEAIAYLAASKNWIGDERNQALAADYKAEAARRITQLWKNDLLFGPVQGEGSPVDFNPTLTGLAQSTPPKGPRPY